MKCVFFDRKFCVLVLLHTLLILIMGLIGWLSGIVWNSLFSQVAPVDVITRIWIMMFVVLVHIVPQWFVLSTMSYVALSYEIKNKWWYKKVYGQFLWMHAYILGIFILLYLLWDLAGSYLQDWFVLGWGVVGITIVAVLYIWLQHSRMLYFIMHHECLCLKMAGSWVVLHWTLGVAVLSLLSYLLPTNQFVQLIMTSVVFGVVLAMDVKRFSRVMQQKS